MKKIAFIQAALCCASLFSMETSVSYKETGSWKNLYGGEVVAVAQSGTVLLTCDETNGPSIVVVENGTAKKFASHHKGSEIFAGPQSGAHAAFSPSSALCAAVIFKDIVSKKQDTYVNSGSSSQFSLDDFSTTVREYKLAFFDVQTGKSLTLETKIPVSGKNWESGKYCNPLVWLNDEMLGIFSSGESQEAQQKISSSLTNIKNTLTLYSLVPEGSEVALFSKKAINFDGMLLRAAHSLGKSSFLVVHDDQKEGNVCSAIRRFAHGEESENFASSAFIFPARFSSMGRVHIAPIAEKKMVAVAASTEPTMYLLDAENLLCLATLTLTDPLITLCASPFKPYLMLVTEPHGTAVYAPKTVSLLSCGELKKAHIMMSDKCVDKEETVSLIEWTESNDILMQKNSGLYGAAASVLIAQAKKPTLAIRKNSSNKNLVEKLRGSFSKLFN